MTLFLSHSAADQGQLESLVDQLDRHSISVYVSWRDIRPAEDSVQWMNGALIESSHMVVAWSEHSAASHHVHREYSSFYFQHPEPGRLLFFRLDDAPIPPLFLALQYVRCSNNIEQDGLKIAQWASGVSNAEVNASVASNPPENLLIEFCASTGRVPFNWVNHRFVAEYAEIADNYSDSLGILGEAVSMVLDADHTASHIRPIDLPGDHAPIRRFWLDAFHNACLHGTRMVAALLLVLDRQRFSAEGLARREELLARLRSTNGH